MPKTTPTQNPAQDLPGDEADTDERNNSADISAAGAVLMCNEHNVAEIECGICQSDRLADLSVGEGMKIRFASNLSISKAGVKTGHAVESSSGAAVELLGRISFNRNEFAMVAPLGGGVITEVLKDVGDAVAAGEVLAIVHSRDIAEARSEYLRVLAESELARLTLAREEDLHREKISARQDFEQAQAAVVVAEAATSQSRQHLHNLGLSEEEIESSSGAQKDMSSPACACSVFRHRDRADSCTRNGCRSGGETLRCCRSFYYVDAAINS